jgi:integrase
VNLQYRPTKDGPAWRLRWKVKDPSTGKWREVSETFHGTKPEARKRWLERQQEITRAGSTYREPSREALRDYLSRWVEAKRADLRPTTWQQYESLIRTRIVPSLGATPLADLTPDLIQRWVDGLRSENLSTRTVSAARGVLRTALQDAVRLGTIRENPVDRTRGPRQQRRRVEAFTMEEGERLLQAAKGARVEHLLRFAFFSGLRKGEILGLKWEDIDFDAGRVTVRRSLVTLKGGTAIHEPKTEAGKRSFALPSPAVEALRAQWRRQAEERLAAGPKWRDEGWVFATTDGGRTNPHNVSRDFKRIRDRAGLPKLPFHALRHSAVSLQIAAGVAPEVISKRIGHRHISVTLDVYGHLLPEADKEAAEAVDRFLSSRNRQPRRGS